MSEPAAAARERPVRPDLKALIGSGDKIGGLVAPFLIIGLALNVWKPAIFSVGGPPNTLRWLSVMMASIGATAWAWYVVLILVKVPRRELITQGPYAIVKHPLYTGVAFLVLPWLGFLFDTWLGVIVGVALYAGSRLFSPEEEVFLSKTFGVAWDDYRGKVLIPWL